MIGLLIHSNLDLFYLPSISISQEVTPILAWNKFDEFELEIIKHYSRKGSISDLIRVSDSKLIGDSTYCLHPYGVNSLGKARFILYQYLDPVLIGGIQDYDVLKGIFLTEGTLNFSRYLRDSSIKYYRVYPSKYPNDLSIDRDPFEFLLIQSGLSRIDYIPFEPDEFNIESNRECWRRYLNEQVDFYEIDSLPR